MRTSSAERLGRCRQNVPQLLGKSAALGHVLASLLAVGKAGDSVPAATRQQAVEAVELMFRVIHGPPQRAAFYVPGVVSAMARILVTSTSKGTRSRLGAAALSC